MSLPSLGNFALTYGAILVLVILGPLVSQFLLDRWEDDGDDEPEHPD